MYNNELRIKHTRISVALIQPLSQLQVQSGFPFEFADDSSVCVVKPRVKKGDPMPQTRFRELVVGCLQNKERFLRLI